MTDEKWENLILNVEEKFGIEEKYQEEDNLTDDLGNVVKGTKEVLIFSNQLGKVKLERIVRPLVVDKKMHYHKGSGGTARVEFVVSDEEFSRTLKAFVYDAGSDTWNELDLRGESINF